MENENNPRLGVQDKRVLFDTLLAMSERLLFINKFPVDQEDFALSLQSVEVEHAWETLVGNKHLKNTIVRRAEQEFEYKEIKWLLHLYPDDKRMSSGSRYGRVFMYSSCINFDDARRHRDVVKNWCDKQIRLEDQILRAARVIRSIVRSCNTVGQYKRVSPDLLAFLPESYQLALRDYTKKSPYPDIDVDQKEIDTMLSSLAFAALQPEHDSETEFRNRPSWSRYGYTLAAFPRSASYNSSFYRHLNL